MFVFFIFNGTTKGIQTRLLNLQLKLKHYQKLSKICMTELQMRYKAAIAQVFNIGEENRNLRYARYYIGHYYININI